MLCISKRGTTGFSLFSVVQHDGLDITGQATLGRGMTLGHFATLFPDMGNETCVSTNINKCDISGTHVCRTPQSNDRESDTIHEIQAVGSRGNSISLILKCVRD